MEINLLKPEQVREKARQMQEYFDKACEMGVVDQASRIHPKPKKNCNHCYGRGYEGKDVNTGHYVPCRCLSR
jgi:hypothetical protein